MQRSMRGVAALIMSLLAVSAFSGCGAASTTDDESDTPIQKRVKACFMSGVTPGRSTQHDYDNCIAGYKYMLSMKPSDTNHGDSEITAAVLEIYAGAISLEMGRAADARARVLDGNRLLTEIAANSDDPDIRLKAAHFRSCLIVHPTASCQTEESSSQK
jgi:hypothetical protein